MNTAYLMTLSNKEKPLDRDVSVKLYLHNQSLPAGAKMDCSHCGRPTTKAQSNSSFCSSRCRSRYNGITERLKKHSLNNTQEEIHE